MSLLHRRHRHRWSQWVYDNVKGHFVYHRSCGCGALQRHDKHTGETTLWTPDGLSSGLLDRGLTRQVYEELN